MSEDVYRRLRDAIVNGELRPGQRIRDYELAEDLGTSKTPVRHALARLAELGLVEMQRNRYTRVAPLDIDHIRDAVAMFGDIWIGSVRHAMPLLQEDDVAYLIDLTDDMTAAITERDVAAFSGALRAVVVGFARIEGNSTRVGAIEVLGPQIRRFTQQARGAFDWLGIERATAEVREAIRQRDAAVTRSAIVRLFDDVLPAIIDRAAEQTNSDESQPGHMRPAYAREA
ncbi:GntR family transcriptional regulator [Microbacterium sp. Se63.02b]|nr:GntR family transcriptional regulator [Microbacterium sp. Se63.02b]QYM65949.1 GntR family transcriptional regulator [Microbacterium sp. Se5.02b]